MKPFKVGRADVNLSVGELQVLKSLIKAELKTMNYDPDNPDVDGAILESILFPVSTALSMAIKEQDAFDLIRKEEANNE